MILTILFLSFTNSTATNAKLPVFARCAEYVFFGLPPFTLIPIS